MYVNSHAGGNDDMKLSWMRWECGFPDQGAGRPVMSCCGARNLLLAIRSQDFDRCHSLLLAAPAAGGARKRPRFGNPPCAVSKYHIRPVMSSRVRAGQPAPEGWASKRGERNILQRY